ncbi:MAG: Glu/Leu/Phe/Val dehydrogenase dimerization domain-containing protein [Candidatus Heteroscillospira sp.]|jgi:glutamate dehydrogenase (NAD(P)+)
MKPYIIVEWNDTETEAHGWLCIYNLVKNYSGGGTRMHPSVTKEEVIRLAKMMAYKYNAAGSDDCGGMKAGIVYDAKKPDAYDVLKRFMQAVRPYVDLGLGIGCDLGTRQSDFDQIFEELGMYPTPGTRRHREDPVCREGTSHIPAMSRALIDGFTLNDTVTGYGVAFCADEAWKILHGEANGARVVIQGFGCVGASCAAKMQALGYKVVGIADAKNLVVCEEGLDVMPLVAHKNIYGEMDPAYFPDNYVIRPNTEWMDVDCDIVIPAALEDVINMNTVDKIGDRLLVEAANIPTSAEADDILRKKNINMVPDFIANVGAIRFFYACRNCKIKFTPESAIADIEQNARSHVKHLYEVHEKNGRYIRDIALEEFAPTIQDVFDCVRVR